MPWWGILLIVLGVALLFVAGAWLWEDTDGFSDLYRIWSKPGNPGLGQSALLATAGTLPYEEDYPYEFSGIRASPDSPGTYYDLAIEYYSDDRFDAARQALYKCISLDTDWPPPHTLLADTYMSLGMRDESLTEYAMASQLAPDDSHVHCNIGIALTVFGEMRESRWYFLRACELAPDNADYRLRLAEVYLDLGDRQAAEVALRQAMELASPGDYIYMTAAGYLEQLR